MGWFKKITKGITKAVNAVADDALGFDPNGGGFVNGYNALGMATLGLPVGSIGSAGVNVVNGDIDKAIQQGIGGAMSLASGGLGSSGGGNLSGILGGILGGGGLGSTMGGLSGILGSILGGGGGGLGSSGGGVSPESSSFNLMQDSPIQRMALLNNQSPLTSRPRKELTNMLLQNLISKQGGA